MEGIRKWGGGWGVGWGGGGGGGWGGGGRGVVGGGGCGGGGGGEGLGGGGGGCVVLRGGVNERKTFLVSPRITQEREVETLGPVHRGLAEVGRGSAGQGTGYCAPSSKNGERHFAHRANRGKEEKGENGVGGFSRPA